MSSLGIDIMDFKIPLFKYYYKHEQAKINLIYKKYKLTLDTMLLEYGAWKNFQVNCFR